MATTVKHPRKRTQKEMRQELACLLIGTAETLSRTARMIADLAAAVEGGALCTNPANPTR